MPKKVTVSREQEKNLARVIQPADVTTNRDLKNYFKQRLGPDFDDLPFILMDRDTYLALLTGSHALLSQMIMEDTDAANEIFLAYAGDKLNRVAITFHIETKTVGDRAIQFIQQHQTAPDHALWLTQMQTLAPKLQTLHHTWKKRPFPYHKLHTAFKSSSPK